MSETIQRPPALIEMEAVEVAALNDSSLTVLENVNWSVPAGEFWVVAGPHHSGKSDLLLNAAGLVAPAGGTCRIFGGDTREFGDSRIAERRRIGFTFADGKLFNHLTIAENVALPLRYHRQPSDAETAARVAAILDLLELTPSAHLPPGNVALAWRQRAALARALVLQPELLLLDNPNAGLTPRHREWLISFLDQLWRGHEFFGGRPMTIVATTDDLLAWQHPDRKFAAVHATTFSVLGKWGGQEFSGHPGVRELLMTPPQADETRPEPAPGRP
jgi:ABC-type transporter Mla maintaining outer membrane lipid asymmetry ATPase subunit MlaF